MPKTGQDSSERIDVAIVGAGCAGLYCAWRLNHHSPRRIWVYERDSRVGGRIVSMDLFPGLTPATPPHVRRKAELGGMRFTSKQLIIKRLVELFQNEAIPEAPFTRQFYKFVTERIYLRSQLIPLAAGQWPATLPYTMEKHEVADPEQLNSLAVRLAKKGFAEAFRRMRLESAGKSRSLTEALTLLLTTDSNGETANLRKAALSLTQWRHWQESATFSGEPISEVGLWNLLCECLTEEEFRCLSDSLGYSSLILNANAAQQIPGYLTDYDDLSYFTLAGGMEVLPRMLAYQNRRFKDCVIAENHQVSSIERISSGRKEHHFKLEVTCTPQNADGEIDARKTYRRSVLADTVILALPQAALKKIHFIGFDANQERRFKENLDGVTSHSAIKLFLGYDQPWWKEELPLESRVITDQAIRQIYYYGGAGENEPAFIMGYADGVNVGFWRERLGNRDWQTKTGILNALSLTPVRYSAPAGIMADATRMLKSIHICSVPDAQRSAIKEWPNAWHFWNVNKRPWDVARDLVQPFGDEKIFTCGESYSLEQGWVEGALKSAERVLRRMQLPHWIGEEQCSAYGCETMDQYIAH